MNNIIARITIIKNCPKKSIFRTYSLNLNNETDVIQ